MKTRYQKLSKYGIDSMVFGKTKSKDYILLWIMIGMIFLIGLTL